MKKKEAIEWLGTIETNYDLALREREAIDMAIEALSSNAEGSDLISRADAIGIIEAAISNEYISARASLYMARAELTALPSDEAVSREEYEKIRKMVSTPFQAVLENYRELERKYSALQAEQEDEPKFYDEDDYWNGRVPAHGRLIDADALMEEYEKTLVQKVSCRTAFVPADVTRLIENAPTVQAEAVQGWIPCSERLPSVSGTYITQTNKGAVCIDHYYADSHEPNWSYYRVRSNPKYWMPLPEPYKGGDYE